MREGEGATLPDYWVPRRHTPEGKKAAQQTEELRRVRLYEETNRLQLQLDWRIISYGQRVEVAGIWFKAREAAEWEKRRVERHRQHEERIKLLKEPYQSELSTIASSTAANKPQLATTGARPKKFNLTAATVSSTAPAPQVAATNARKSTNTAEVAAAIERIKHLAATGAEAAAKVEESRRSRSRGRGHGGPPTTAPERAIFKYYDATPFAPPLPGPRLRSKSRDVGSRVGSLQRVPEETCREKEPEFFLKLAISDEEL